jgi:hypothetical protein
MLMAIFTNLFDFKPKPGSNVFDNDCIFTRREKRTSVKKAVVTMDIHRGSEMTCESSKASDKK